MGHFEIPDTSSLIKKFELEHAIFFFWSPPSPTYPIASVNVPMCPGDDKMISNLP